MLEIINDPSLEMLSTIGHGFFTRQGGVSTGVHASLNCCYNSKDHPDNIKENRRRVTAYLGQPAGSLISTKNVHGNQVIVVNEPWSELSMPEADGMVTNKKNIILGADTADCPSVLFADDIAGVIGTCHAGWRGAKSGIVHATIEKMQHLGAKSHQIIAVIGPSIAQQSYEVSHDFYQAFLADNMGNGVYFKPTSASKYLFNLKDYVKNQLDHWQLKTVSVSAIDTYTDEERFFSCRRATHRKEEDFGGHLACIYLK